MPAARLLPRGCDRLEARFDGFQPVQDWVIVYPEVAVEVVVSLEAVAVH